ncbi:MAG: InlB B-repeat-containing protein, partial [Clostridia bacterium]|nr:InlB B-repeat-containing protein [Clostridia bacterium]
MKNARKLLSLLLCAVLLLAVVPMTALRAKAAESTPQEKYKIRLYCRIIDNTNPDKYGSVTCKITCRNNNGRGNSTKDYYIDHDTNCWHENESVFDQQICSLHWMFSYGKDKSFFTEYTVPDAGYFPVSVYMKWTKGSSNDSCEWKWNFKVKNLYSTASNPYLDISDTPQKKGNTAEGTAYLNESYLPTSNGINAVSGDAEVWIGSGGGSVSKTYTAKAYDNRGYTLANSYTFTSSNSKATVASSGTYSKSVTFTNNSNNYTTSIGAQNVFNSTTRTATAKSVTVYVPHTLTINPNGGSYNGSTSNSTVSGLYSKANGTSYPRTATLDTPTRTGYTFDGWEVSSGSGSVSGSTFTAADSNATVRAKWKANTYTATLNANGGSGGTASVTATYDSAMPSATMPTRTGYTFAGYYDTSAASGGTQYYTAAGASARTWNKTSASTLYARWTANTNTPYKVNHYYMNTSGAYDAEASQTDNKTGTTAAAVTHTNVKADRTGFTYDGALSGTSSTIAADGSTVINLYYSRNQHTVTFVDAYTGQTLKTQTGVYYGTGATAPTPAAYHEIEGDGANHMKFTGWDQAFDDITDDLTVNALYEEEAHDVWSGYTNNCDDHSRTCESCGYVETGSHVWAWTVDDDPTCGAAGKKHQECENCDAVQNENTVIEPTGEHVWKWVVDTDPTCGAAGKHHQECENCDAVQSENTVIEPTGEHVWKWVVDTDPTCGAAGK